MDQTQLDKLATKENSEAYFKETDQFVFCIDLLEISAHELSADHWVNSLEARFEEIRTNKGG